MMLPKKLNFDKKSQLESGDIVKLIAEKDEGALNKDMKLFFDVLGSEDTSIMLEPHDGNDVELQIGTKYNFESVFISMNGSVEQLAEFHLLLITDISFSGNFIATPVFEVKLLNYFFFNFS